MSPKFFLYSSTATLFLLSGCTVHRVQEFKQPTVEVPTRYLRQYDGIPVPQKWWKEFNQQQLNEFVDKALAQNLDIRQAWSRLDQARAQVCITASELNPTVDLIANVKYRGDYKIKEKASSDRANYLISPSLSYEVDLWKRVQSRVMASEFNAFTTLEDLEATAVFLTGAVVDLWLSIQEQKALVNLINHQIKVSETLLELVELRFSIGESSALDVYQQRLQYEETRSQLIPVEAQLKTSSHQLHILLGEPPEDWPEIEPGLFSVQLPPFPDLGTPAELLDRRPDLRAARYKLIASDYEVAAAIADLYPRLTLPASFEFKGDIGKFITEMVYETAAKIVQPLFDSGRRRCEVERRQAILCEKLLAYGQRFLIALREVEDAIVNEKSQQELLKQLEYEVELARLNLEEAHQRYANGLNDYLTVISAIQSLQRLERRVIGEHRRLLINRSQLYRALGVPCLVGCYDEESACSGEELYLEGEN